MELTVGQAEGDIRGDTNLAIQAAVDQAAAAGGGTVTLLPGMYTMHDAVRMRSHTSLVGSGDGTVLRKADGWEARLWEDGDWGNEWAACDPLPPVEIGQGVQITSDRDTGWSTTVATVVAVEENRVRVSRPFEGNHMVRDNARISATHSIIDVDGAHAVSIRDLVIDGNRANNVRLDGCRGGGIHGLFSNDVSVAGVTVRDLNGDAISFQRSDDWTVTGCLTEGNTGHGLHPGSGSQRPIARDCVSRGNGNCGIFVCWRVRHGLFERNTFESNTAAGVSIGHKDTDNVFRENRIVGNEGPGILSRDEAAPMCPDRCRYESNVIEGNHGGGPQVVVLGEVADLVFRENRYDSEAPRFEVGPKVGRIETE